MCQSLGQQTDVEFENLHNILIHDNLLHLMAIYLLLRHKFAILYGIYKICFLLICLSTYSATYWEQQWSGLVSKFKD